MPLEAPPLDTRTFEEIYQEARLRIPRYLPEWTDHNESDPGVALVQLFAWLTEAMIYRLNQTPERNYIKFLQLLNLERRPAQPARAYLTFTAQPEFAQVPSVPQYTQVEGQPTEGPDPLIFETETGLDLIRPPLVKVVVYDGAQFRDFTIKNQEQDVTFRPLGWVPQLDNALYLGFEQTKTELKPPIFPQQMCFRIFLHEQPLHNRAQSCEAAALPPVSPVTLVWEYRSPADPTRWRALNLFLDETAGFTQEGYIRMAGPREMKATRETDDPPETLRYWLRCRLAKGAYPSGHAPEIDMIQPNVVTAVNLVTVRDEVLHNDQGEFVSDGRPYQIFRLRNRPVMAQSLVVEVNAQEESLELLNAVPQKRWMAVEDLLGSTEHDQHFTFNANKGELCFGDGTHGQIPVAGAEIVARVYRYGGGKGGNVPPEQITALLTTVPGVDTVTNLRAAVGGRDEQRLDEFKQQAPGELRRRRRAVTAEDFATLAQQAGGVAKAHAIALRHPDFPTEVKVPGAVTVVIVPDTQDKPPLPSAEQIKVVCRHLNQHRLLTTEVYVKGADFKAIRVEATVAANPYAAFDVIAQALQQHINDYLDPLRLPVPDDPWPVWDFGNELQPTSLYAVFMRVKDVTSVKALALYVDGVPHDLDKPVVVPPDGLVYGVDDHEIVVVPKEDL